MRNKKKTKEEFLLKFKEKYPNLEIKKFTKISDEIIVIDENGFEYKKSSALHVLKNTFSIESVVDKLGYLNFKLKNIFPNLTILKYNGMKNKCLVKDENNFYYTPQCYDLLKGHPVSIQTCTEKEKLFKYKANLKHNNFYEYPKFKYINGKQKIKIKCKLHGNYEQTIEAHLFGNGCRHCGSVGFTKESWLKRLKNKEAIFYILKFYNDNEEFIKIGITTKNVPKRYLQMNEYQYDVIKIIKGVSSNIYDIEKIILQKYKPNKYIPKIKFDGHTECFHLNTLNNIINENCLCL